MAAENNALDKVIDLKNNPSVIAHIEMTQGIINRLADNSAKCKEWCFTLIGALLVFVFSTDNTGKFNYCTLYYIIGIFCILDAFYLGLERNHKTHLLDFIDKINKQEGQENKKGIENIEKDIFLPYGSEYKKPCWFEKWILHLWWTIQSFGSFSILIPYGLMILVTWLLS